MEWDGGLIDCFVRLIDYDFIGYLFYEQMNNINFLNSI